MYFTFYTLPSLSLSLAAYHNHIQLDTFLQFRSVNNFQTNFRHHLQCWTSFAYILKYSNQIFQFITLHFNFVGDTVNCYLNCSLLGKCCSNFEINHSEIVCCFARSIVELFQSTTINSTNNILTAGARNVAHTALFPRIDLHRNFNFILFEIHYQWSMCARVFTCLSV